MEDTEFESKSVPKITTVYDLPEEVLEFILMKVSPYRDLKSAGMVCHSWYRIVKVVLRKLRQLYLQGVYTANLEWSTIVPDTGCRITERYSHSCCYYDKCLYVFGGCTATNTTLNDLWRFDLASREWIRPLAMGTYPFPKACASLVVYKDNLVLFGGWSHPTPFPLHQAARFFSELHIYKPSLNRWSHVTTLSNQSPQPVAGHSASVVGDTMVVFGGSQVPGFRTNELWVFDFNENTWRQPRTGNRKPAPRYGQTQVTLDDSHILILGGKGGAGNPHLVYSDCWLLTMEGEEWSWEEVNIDNMDWSPSQLWCHSACKVSDMIVTLCKAAKKPEFTLQPQPSSRPSKQSKKLNSTEEKRLLDQANQNLPNVNTSETNQSGACGSGLSNQMRRNQSSSSSSSDSLSMDQSEDSSESDNSSDQSEFRTASLRPGLPSIRPNAMKNRQKQLEALLKYEKKFRQNDDSGSLNNNTERPGPSGISNSVQIPNLWPQRSEKSCNPASLMVLHVLDIADVIETKKASWQKLNFEHLDGAPEETIFYTLVEGRGELLMFGGIERDIHSLKWDYCYKSHTVNHSLHVLSPIQQLL